MDRNLFILMWCLLAAFHPTSSSAEAEFHSIWYGNGSNAVAAITMESDGYVFMAGHTSSTDLPFTQVLGVAHRDSAADTHSVIVSKVNPTNGDVLFTILIGGSSDDRAESIAMDSQGNVVIAGTTSSTNFPVRDAIQSIHGGATDAFVLKLDGSNGDLLFSTFLGGSLREKETRLAVDSDNHIVVAGVTESEDFPTQAAWQNHLADVQNLVPPFFYFYGDVFLIKIDGGNHSLIFSTYLGGGSAETPVGLATDSAGAIYVAGSTSSSDFPVVEAPHPMMYGDFPSASVSHGDGFLLKVAPDGSNLIYSTYLGFSYGGGLTGMKLIEGDGIWLLGNDYSIQEFHDVSYSTPANNSYQLPIPPPPSMSNAVLLKQSQDGSELLSRISLATGRDSFPFEMMVGVTGDIFILGKVGAYVYESSRYPSRGSYFLQRYSREGASLDFLEGLDRCQAVHWDSAVMSDAGDIYLTGQKIDKLLAPGGSVGREVVLVKISAEKKTIQSSPLVFMTNPLDEVVFGLGTPVYLSASTVETEFPVDRVEFYAGTNHLGSACCFPYHFWWTNAPSGDHELTAMAVDCFGQPSVSCPIRIHMVEPPINDNIADAIVISEMEQTWMGSTRGATLEAGEKGSGYGNVIYSTGALRRTEQSVWWRWTAPSNGVYRVVAKGTETFPGFRIYEGSDFSTIISDQATPTVYDTYELKVLLKASEQTVYSIGLSGIDSLPVSVSLRVEAATLLENDDFADRVTLFGENVTWSGTSGEATVEEHEPIRLRLGVEGSVWWSWTAPFSGQVDLQILNANFRMTVEVFVGDVLEELVRIGNRNIYQPREPNSFAAKAGSTYQLRFGLPYYEALGFDAQLRLQPFVVNDDFANRISLMGASVVTNGSTVGSSLEPDETLPGVSPFYERHSVWYDWTPSVTGLHTLELCSSDFDPAVVIFEGDTLTNLLQLDGNWESLFVGCATVTFMAEVGQTYPIVIYESAEVHGVAGDFALEIRMANPPSNDDFSNRLPLIGSEVHVQAHNWEATMEEGEFSTIGYPTNLASVWWSWTAPVDGMFRFRIQSQSYKQEALLYRGNEFQDLDSTQQVFQWKSPTYPFWVSFTANAGEVFSLVVLGEMHDFEFWIEWQPPYELDQFAQRATLTGGFVGSRGNNRIATLEFGESLSRSNATGATLWWDWSPPKDGYYTLTKWYADSPSVLNLFEGTELADLKSMASLTGQKEQFTFFAEEDRRYPIMMDGLDGRRGHLEFFLRLAHPPANDLFRNSVPLDGAEAVAYGSTFDATREQGEPEHVREENGRSIWWSWTAPADGRVEIEVTQVAAGIQNDLNSALAAFDESDGSVPIPPRLFQITPPCSVFTGSNVSNLTAVEIVEVRGVFEFQAVAAQVYHVLLDRPIGNYGLTIRMPLVQPPTPTILGFLPIRQLSDGTYVFEAFYQTDVGRTNVIQYSTNLVHWHSEMTNVALNRDGWISIQLKPEEPVRFYRIQTW